MLQGCPCVRMRMRQSHERAVLIKSARLAVADQHMRTRTRIQSSTPYCPPGMPFCYGTWGVEGWEGARLHAHLPRDDFRQFTQLLRLQPQLRIHPGVSQQQQQRGCVLLLWVEKLEGSLDFLFRFATGAVAFAFAGLTNGGAAYIGALNPIPSISREAGGKSPDIHWRRSLEVSASEPPCFAKTFTLALPSP